MILSIVVIHRKNVFTDCDLQGRPLSQEGSKVPDISGNALPPEDEMTF